MKPQIKTKKLSGKALMLFVLFLLLASNLSFAQSGWYMIHTDTSKFLMSTYFVNSNTGFAVGGKFVNGIPFTYAIKTTNAGNNWFELTTPFTGNVNFCHADVWFIDMNTGIITTTHYTNFNDGGLIRTTNGGLNWEIVYAPEYFENITFVNSLTGYVSGHGFISKTTDAGANWTIQDPGYISVLAGIKFTDPNNGYVVGNHGNIRKTTNGGDLWFSVNPGYTIVNLWGIDFINANTGFIVGGYHNQLNIILKTTNAGNNWDSVQYADSTAWLYTIRFISLTTGYIIGWGSRVIKTTNGGLNWFDQSFPLGAMCNRTCFFTDMNTGYIVGHSNPWASIPDTIDYIFKTTSGGVTWIKPVSNEVPTEFRLEQNYPNPFNPVTSIKFQVASVGDRSQETEVMLIVFDLLGREVATLVNEKLQAGTYEVTFDAGNLPSGVYFYKLLANNFSATKKLVLQK